MEQKAILRLIIQDVQTFTLKKKSLEGREKKLSLDAEEIKEKLADAKDISEEDKTLYEEKVAEVRKLAKIRKEDYKRVQKEKIELKSEIKESKEKIIDKLKDNQKEIFENRNKVGKLTREDRKKLIEERKKLYKEIRSDENRKLIHTTRAALREMSDEDREKVEQARQMTKEKKSRISEISKELDIDSGDFFDRLNPQELFKRNKIIIKKVEESFNLDKIDTLASKITNIVEGKEDFDDKKIDENSKSKQEQKPKENEKPKQEQISKENDKPEQQQKTQQMPQQIPEVINEQQQIQQQYQNGIANNPLLEYVINRDITIFEKEGIAVYNFGNQQGVISLKEVNEDRKAMFKRNGIRKMVGFRASRRVNPAIIKVLEQVKNGNEMIDAYLQSIKGKRQFNFQLNHDLTGLNIFQKISRNRQAKREQKCGATVAGKLFNRENTLMITEAEQQNVSVKKQPIKRAMDSWVKADTETLHKIQQVSEKATDPIENEGQDKVGSNKVQEENTI